jgi:hypothetical protein
MNATQSFLNYLFEMIQTLKQDFEIKRFSVGLTSLVTTDPSQLPEVVQQNLGNIMKALVFLSKKSIIVREQSPSRSKEEDIEDVNIENEIIEDEGDCEDIMSDEDEDEDYSCEEIGEVELYDSKLDSIDEVLNFRDAIAHLEQTNPRCMHT